MADAERGGYGEGIGPTVSVAAKLHEILSRPEASGAGAGGLHGDAEGERRGGREVEGGEDEEGPGPRAEDLSVSGPGLDSNIMAEWLQHIPEHPPLHPTGQHRHDHVDTHREN